MVLEVVDGEEFGVEVVVNDIEGLRHEEMDVKDPSIDSHDPRSKCITLKARLHEQWKCFDCLRQNQLAMGTCRWTLNQSNRYIFAVGVEQVHHILKDVLSNDLGGELSDITQMFPQYQAQDTVNIGCLKDIVPRVVPWCLRGDLQLQVEHPDHSLPVHCGVEDCILKVGFWSGDLILMLKVYSDRFIRIDWWEVKISDLNLTLTSAVIEEC